MILPGDDRLESDEETALTSGSWIDGIQHEFLSPHRDNRGSFTEIFYNSWDTGIEPRQWSAVNSMTRVLRGMHLHLRHDEYICILKGMACVGLYDLRKSSPTYKSHSLVELNGDRPARLSFPAGVLHAWYFYEDSIHIQAVSETFETYGQDDNWGCYFGDPELGIPWPDLNPILSQRARNFPNLDALAELLDEYAAARECGVVADESVTRYASTEVI